VPLHDKIVAVVKAWRPEGVSPEAYVFPGDEGKPMTSLKTSWMAIAKAARLKHFRFHDLRHSFASRLVQAGVDLATVRELLGHSDFALTLRYSHLSAANKEAAVAKLGGV
jgi:integrase